MIEEMFRKDKTETVLENRTLLALMVAILYPLVEKASYEENRGVDVEQAAFNLASGLLFTVNNNLRESK